ncbi:hypothetical protein PORY_000750 [Pneumocystis oryctolagi]|uniref:Uncharacterized protein n=1 Tax=Pneumocystis oryctolagi TaxID=42067 RepID=A0ACB7CE99_9ASCO|nr:hypothetical protein PORY_000750 [Pneumocystis oryctolagi]
MDKQGKILKFLTLLLLKTYSIKSSDFSTENSPCYEIKQHTQSWRYGIELALHKDIQMDMFRHFGLNLIEHSIRCNWNTYVDEDKTHIQNFMIRMCYDVGVRNGISHDQQEAYYIKQKISQILSRIVEKNWEFVLSDVDSALQDMFLISPTARDISLNTILNLIENAFQYNDNSDVSKGFTLSTGIISILCSSNVLKIMYPNGLPNPLKIRENNSGWINIFKKSIESYFGTIDTSCFPKINEVEIIHILNCLKSCLFWIPTKSILESGILNQLCFALLQGDIEIKTISSDCLHTLFIRPLSAEDKLLEVIHTFFEPNNLNYLRILMEDISSQIQHNDYNNFDEKKYTFLKKIVETIIALGTSHILNNNKKDTFCHLNIYLDLVIFITKHPSLIVSSISLPFWITLLKSHLNKENATISILPHLLDVISNRLIRYENAQILLKNSPEIKFLNHDIETVQEMHTRDCLSYAQQHIKVFFETCSDLISDDQTVSSKKKTNYLFYDSNFTFIETILKGYKVLDEENKHLHNDLKEVLLSFLIYCFQKTVDMNIKEPLILSRQIQILITFLCFFKKKEFLIPVLEKTISAAVYSHSYSNFDKIQEIYELRRKCNQELLRLALELSDLLWSIYPQLEKIIYGIINEEFNENENTVFNTFLLIISQKSNNTLDEKMYHFQYITSRLINAWNKTTSRFDFTVFNGFFDLLGLQKIAQYIQSKNIQSFQDLDTTHLDIEGKQLINELKETRKLIWPISGFQKFADYHLKIVSLKNNDNDYISRLWEPIIDFILPYLFSIIKHIHALHNPDNWTSFIPELQFIISQSIVEKFWLHGISLISKDEFYEQISRSESRTIELAYGLGHFLRKNRDYCYSIIGLFSNFGIYFYKNPNLIQNIINSFFTDIKGLSLYAWSNILDLSISPLLIKCPYEYQAIFFKTLLPYLFTEINKELVSKWSAISERGLVSNNDFSEIFYQNKDLSDEMIQESLLRHLSFVTVKLLRDLLIPSNKAQSITNISENFKTDNIPYILQNYEILESLFPLLLHLVMLHDTRTSHNAVLILRSVVPILINSPNTQICAFITNDLFKACLVAVNDTYLVSIHHEIVTILIQIYTLAHERGFHQSKNILLSMVSDSKKFYDFEIKLFNIKNSKSKRAVMIDFLSSLGIKPGINGKKCSKKFTCLNVNTNEIIKRIDSKIKASDTYKEDILEREENIELSVLFE